MNMARYDWGFRTEPEPHLGGRAPRHAARQGARRVVLDQRHGLRPRPPQRLRHLGRDGRRRLGLGRRRCPTSSAWRTGTAAHSDWRGNDGPLHVTRGRRRNPLYHAFVEAGAQAGFELTYDYNGAKQEGFGPMEQTVWRGRRWSAANAYLRPALRGRNVAVVSGLATRVRDRGRPRHRRRDRRAAAPARPSPPAREVILSASSINTPKLLMLSGIGPAGHLAEHGIAPRRRPPRRRRQPAGPSGALHPDAEPASRSPSTASTTTRRCPASALSGCSPRTGLGTSNQFESAAFVRSAAGIDYPDIQYHFLPLAVRYDGKAAVRGHGFQAHVGPMRSPSRGTVRLRAPTRPSPRRSASTTCPTRRTGPTSAAASASPARSSPSPPSAPTPAARSSPAPHVQTDDELDGFVREHAESAYHPCGTAAPRAPRRPAAVVDPQCRVIGVERLRVADSSIFPRITNGNLNAPSIMVGEKAADHILGRDPLPRSNLAPWINPRWQTTDPVSPDRTCPRRRP